VSPLVGCAGAPAPDEWLNPHLWATASAEYAAVSLQTYVAAGEQLKVGLADPHWTACLEQGEGFEGLPPAIIVDLDETVLDNRPFQMRLLRANREFDEKLWNEWVNEKRVDAVPGAVAMLRKAAALGVEVFYLTNRTHSVEAATRENLEALGLPLNAERDTLLTKNERPNWSSDKVSRRVFVTETHRVLLILGDHLQDFADVASFSQKRRRETIFEHRERWGRQWFMMPNPMYGGWLAAAQAADSTE
jgi:acid phosphatase